MKQYAAYLTKNLLTFLVPPTVVKNSLQLRGVASRWRARVHTQPREWPVTRCWEWSSERLSFRLVQLRGGFPEVCGGPPQQVSTHRTSLCISENVENLSRRRSEYRLLCSISKQRWSWAEEPICVQQKLLNGTMLGMNWSDHPLCIKCSVSWIVLICKYPSHFH